jgi:hypothetical protein
MQRMTEDVPHAEEAIALRRLVLTAFETARLKGKPDWKSMTLGVLKNRLLQATGGDFREQAYGFGSMIDLVQAMPDALRLDAASRPPTVTIEVDTEQVSDAALNILGDRIAIRQDLWRAVMDYSAGGTWFWAEDRAQLADSQAEIAGLEMPTITPDVLRGWRQDFLQRLLRLPPGEAPPDAQIAQWLVDGARTYRLPSWVKQTWNGELKRRVLAVLSEFFEGHGLEAPADVLTTDRRGPNIQSSSSAGLRSFVEACISMMSDAELSALAIPASVAARVSVRRAASTAPQRRS